MRLDVVALARVQRLRQQMAGRRRASRRARRRRGSGRASRFLRNCASPRARAEPRLRSIICARAARTRTVSPDINCAMKRLSALVISTRFQAFVARRRDRLREPLLPVVAWSTRVAGAERSVRLGGRESFPFGERRRRRVLRRSRPAPSHFDAREVARPEQADGDLDLGVVRREQLDGRFERGPDEVVLRGPPRAPGDRSSRVATARPASVGVAYCANARPSSTRPASASASAASSRSRGFRRRIRRVARGDGEVIRPLVARRGRVRRLAARGRGRASGWPACM